MFNRLKRAIAVLTGFSSAYATTDPSRKTVEGLVSRSATANQALAGNLTTLVAQCRHMERTSAEVRAAVNSMVAEIVGSGIDVMPSTGNAKLDLALLQAWQRFAETACVDGTPLYEWQAAAVRDMIVAGSSLDRLVMIHERLEKGLVPLAILPLEVEWISELQVGRVASNNTFIRGIEVNSLGLPQFYHLANPESLSTTNGERVPAADVLHAFEKRRKQQIHGEPVLAPALERFFQIDRLMRSETQAAINTSGPAIAITSESRPSIVEDDDENPVTDISSGSVVHLLPGEDIKTVAPTRPNPAVGEFYQVLIGAIAAATNCARSGITRDFARTTFMNARFEQQYTQRALAPFKSMVGRHVAGRVYEGVFDWLLMQVGVPKPSSAAERARLMRYEIRPDMPPYVDPVKDVTASINAIANNLSTYDIECSSRGKDFRQILTERQRENEMLAAAGLPIPVPTKPGTAPEQKQQPDEAEDEVEEPENV